MLTRDLSLAVDVWDPRAGTRSMLTREILGIPSEITGIYDEGPAWMYGGDPGPHAFGFSFPLAVSLAGVSFAEIGGLAAELAGHLAGADPDWPGGHAHVRMFAVIDFGPLRFKVTPKFEPSRDFGLPERLASLAGSVAFASPELAASLRKMADEAAQPCGCEACA